MEEKTNYLAHHGVKGMRWGVRRYQNPDGSLTAAGRKKYGTSGGPKNGILYSGKEIKKIREERINVENKEEVLNELERSFGLTGQAKTRDNIKYTAAFIAMTGAFVAPHIINQRRAAIGKFKV